MTESYFGPKIRRTTGLPATMTPMRHKTSHAVLAASTRNEILEASAKRLNRVVDRAREKVIMGDEYMSLLSRYDKALEFYRAALQLDPNNADIAQRVALAEGRRYVSMSAFATVRTGMKEDEVRGIVGLPREDWIKQVAQNGRVYSVWIYPKSDGGASAIYFDNGVVYHTNWNAAAPPAPATR